jgi:hypothetical protein
MEVGARTLDKESVKTVLKASFAPEVSRRSAPTTDIVTD